jgi:hypothetical protein
MSNILDSGGGSRPLSVKKMTSTMKKQKNMRKTSEHEIYIDRLSQKLQNMGWRKSIIHNWVSKTSIDELLYAHQHLRDEDVIVKPS